MLRQRDLLRSNPAQLTEQQQKDLEEAGITKDTNLTVDEWNYLKNLKVRTMWYNCKASIKPSSDFSIWFVQDYEDFVFKERRDPKKQDAQLNSALRRHRDHYHHGALPVNVVAEYTRIVEEARKQGIELNGLARPQQKVK